VEIPLSLGPRKEGLDKEGGVCLVFDFVVAPATLENALGSPGMMKTVVETVSGVLPLLMRKSKGTHDLCVQVEQ